jgi:hypothetical protein
MGTNMVRIGSKEALNKFLGNVSIPSGAKARVDFAGSMYGLKPVPFTKRPKTKKDAG